MAKISFYLSRFEKSSIAFLSQILNLNLLNSQCHFLAPRLLIDQSYKTAVSEINKFFYIGRTDNLGELVRRVTYAENEFGVSLTNNTVNKKVSWDDFDSYLKNFLYKRMKPDFLLYESVRDKF